MKSTAQAFLTRLEEIVGAACVSADPAELSARQVDGLQPQVVVQPGDVAQISEIMRMAAAETVGYAAYRANQCHHLVIPFIAECLHGARRGVADIAGKVRVVVAAFHRGPRRWRPSCSPCR